MGPNLEELGIKDEKELQALRELAELVNFNFKSFNPDKNSVLIQDGHVKGISISYASLPSNKDMFSEFKNLEELYLYCNKLEEIPKLDTLVNLKRLALSGNQIKTIQNLEYLINLSHLELARNKISEIENLNKNIHLKSLNLSYNQIKEIKGLFYLRELEELNLRGNKIREIENLNPLGCLQKLYLDSNQIQEIVGLERQVKLKEFEIGGNPLTKQYENLLDQPAQYWVNRDQLNSESEGHGLPPMVLIPFIGFSKSGKTTSIENIIQFLSKKPVNLIALKHIHQDNFSFDTPGKNTWRYSQAGARVVVAQSEGESAVIFNWQRKPLDILKMIQRAGIDDNEFQPDWPFIALLEGFRDIGDQVILCAKTSDEIFQQFNERIVAIGGIVSADEETISLIQSKIKVPIIDISKEPEKLLELWGLSEIVK